MGHVLAAHYALLRYPIDQVWVLPVWDHPYHKSLADAQQRMQWCRAAFSHLPQAIIKDDEQRNPGGRTATLLDLLEQDNPRYHFSLVGGSDTEADLKNWYRGDELQQRLPVLVVPRGGFDQDPYALPAISSSLVREKNQQSGAD